LSDTRAACGSLNAIFATLCSFDVGAKDLTPVILLSTAGRRDAACAELGRMIRKLRTLSPALVISLIALFVSLAGTSMAAVPPVQRALFADNAGKLQGKKLKQVAAMPGPTRSVGDLVYPRTAERMLQRGQETDVTVSCGPGGKALSGGYFSDDGVAVRDTRASTESAWTYRVVNLNESTAEVTVQVICLR
jgi:hypothetical protein